MKKHLEKTNFAVGYCRYSSNGQRDESIDAQKRAIEKYAKENDLIITRWYIDEAKTGTTTAGRNEFLDMISDSKKHLFSYVIVHKLNRFARSRFDSVYYKRQLGLNWVSVLSVTEKLDDSPESLFLESMLESQAEYYSRDLSREAIKGLNENAYKSLCNGGRPPYGYRRVPRIMNGIPQINKDGLPLHDTEIDPHTSNAVKLIFDWTLLGKTRKQIIEDLNGLGYRDFEGKEFKRPGYIDSILRNERYTGVYIFHEYKRVPNMNGRKSKVRNNPEDMIRNEGGFPQIISKDTFNAVQKILAERVHRSPANVQEDYLLSGKIFCADCEKAYVGYTKRKKGIDYSYYKCMGNFKNRKDEDAPRCDNTSVRKEDLEQYVLKNLIDLLSDKNLPNKIYDNFMLFMKTRSYNKQVIDSYNSRLIDIDKQIKNLINAISHTGNELLINKLQQLDAEKQEVQLKKSAEEKESMEISISKTQLEKSFQSAVEILKNKDSSIDEKKTIINLFVNKILVEKDSVSIFFNTIPTSQSGNLSLDITDECHIWYKKKSYGKVPQENILGWGGRIRTHEMEESESSALPLGDTPICDCFDY